MTTTDGNQYAFMQGAINVLSVKASSPASLFAVEAHDERVRVTDLLDKSSRSDAQSLLLLACAARLLILVRAYFHKGKYDRLVVLLRIMRKLMNIVCRLLKSRAAITGWWDLQLIRKDAESIAYL